MKKMLVEAEATRTEVGGFLVVVKNPGGDNVGFSTCGYRQNVGKTAIRVASDAFNLNPSRIKLVKVDYVDNTGR